MDGYEDDGWELTEEDLRAMGLLVAPEHAGDVPGLDQTASPFPDVHELFRHYNYTYFESKLDFCSVEWSTGRMTLCAGICQYSRNGGCRIKLSEPLLKFRPVKDMKETLLHEMIHAYMFLEGIRDHDDHGPKFKAKMYAINQSKVPDYQRPSEGYNIDTHHTMHDEVDLYRKHWWQCDKCSRIVKRAMNRPPQPADCRGRQGKGDACQDKYCLYHMHIKTCGGNYIKIKGPDIDAAANGDSSKGKAKQNGGRRMASGSSSSGKPGSSSGFGGGLVAQKRPPDGDVNGPAGSLSKKAAGGGVGGGGHVQPITNFFKVPKHLHVKTEVKHEGDVARPGRDQQAAPLPGQKASATGGTAAGTNQIRQPQQKATTGPVAPQPQLGVKDEQQPSQSGGGNVSWPDATLNPNANPEPTQSMTAKEAASPPVDMDSRRRLLLGAALQRLTGGQAVMDSHMNNNIKMTGASSGDVAGTALQGAPSFGNVPRKQTNVQTAQPRQPSTSNAQQKQVTGGSSDSPLSTREALPKMTQSRPPSAPAGSRSKTTNGVAPGKGISRQPPPSISTSSSTPAAQKPGTGSNAKPAASTIVIDLSDDVEEEGGRAPQKPSMAPQPPPTQDSKHIAGSKQPNKTHGTTADAVPKLEDVGVSSGVERKVGSSSTQTAQNIKPVAKLVCPVCMCTWPAGSLSNSELNAHLDACLMR